MMHTTSSYDFDSGIALIGILHAIGSIAVLIGALFLIIWAAKTLTEKQMKLWGLRLLIGGAIVCLLTLIVLPAHRIERGNMMFKMQRSPDVVNEVSEVQGMAHMMPDGTMMGGTNMMMTDADDAMHMSMADMSAMLKGKTGDDFDAAFLEGMIPHHQGAIDMANAAATSAKHAEIKKMAADIISAQQKEIDMMKAWQKSWGYAQ